MAHKRKTVDIYECDACGCETVIKERSPEKIKSPFRVVEINTFNFDLCDPCYETTMETLTFLTTSLPIDLTFKVVK